MRKKVVLLVQTKQHKQNKTSTAFAEEMTDRMDVPKAAGVTFSKQSVLECAFKGVWKGSKKHKNCVRMRGSDDATVIERKEEMDDCAPQIMLTRAVIHGGSSKMHQSLRHELERNFSKGKENCPNIVKAVPDLLNQREAKQLPKRKEKVDDRPSSIQLRSKTSQTQMMQAQNQKSAAAILHSSATTNACVFAQQAGGQINCNWLPLDSQASCNVMCNQKTCVRNRMLLAILFLTTTMRPWMFPSSPSKTWDPSPAHFSSQRPTDRHFPLLHQGCSGTFCQTPPE